MKHISLVFVLVLGIPIAATAQVCTPGVKWKRAEFAWYDRVTDKTRAVAAKNLSFTPSVFNATVQYNLHLSAGYNGRVSSDTAKLEFVFWKRTQLAADPTSGPAMRTMADSLSLAVLVNDSLRFTWPVSFMNATVDHSILTGASVSEIYAIKAPAPELNTFMQAKSVMTSINGIHPNIDAAQLHAWYAFLRWAYCPAERPVPSEQ